MESIKGITVNPAKIVTTAKWLRPTTVIESCGFWGYYRRFAHEFSRISAVFSHREPRRASPSLGHQHANRVFKNL